MEKKWKKMLVAASNFKDRISPLQETSLPQKSDPNQVHQYHS